MIVPQLGYYSKVSKKQLVHWFGTLRLAKVSFSIAILKQSIYIFTTISLANNIHPKLSKYSCKYAIAGVSYPKWEKYISLLFSFGITHTVFMTETLTSASFKDDSDIAFAAMG